MAEERLEEIREQRLKKRADLLAAGQVPYPSEAKRSHLAAELVAAAAALQDAGTPVTVAGRIMSVRRHGGVVFLDLQDASGTIQLQATRAEVPAEIWERIEALDAGDFLQASGSLIQTARGVLTVAVREAHLLSKSVRPLPSTWYGLKDQESRLRQRELDLLLNDEARRALTARGRLMQWLRTYFTEAGYLEVETPVLQAIPGGAAARPFVTHHNTLDMELYLRIAAELYLKRMLVAGFEKVFEIGPRFRNEGISRQHNPEFSMLESQWAYADYEDLMTFTEEILERLFTELAGSSTVTWQGEELSFAAPFKRVRYVEMMSEAVGFDILAEREPARYEAVFAQHQLAVPETRTYYHLVDELYKELVRPNLRQPTLVYDYPAEMAPLAKRSLQDPRVAEKFQTVAAGMELNNCYTELNDPVIQRELLVEQQAQREAGDAEAQAIDEAYLRAMEYGMPPNAGWSLGIDRVVMLLADMPSIRDTLAFPLLRPEQSL